MVGTTVIVVLLLLFCFVFSSFLLFFVKKARIVFFFFFSQNCVWCDLIKSAMCGLFFPGAHERSPEVVSRKWYIFWYTGSPRLDDEFM